MVDDNSCYQGGCTDSRFEIFDPSASYDDGSCSPVLTGCMHSDANNYRALATVENGSCIYKGCTDPTAFNHDASATLAGQCITIVLGCLDSAAQNFYKGANTASGICTYIGCTDSVRPNYDPTATFDDGLCTPLHPGCTNSRALNYDAWSNQDDGSCVILGCKATDPSVTFNIPFLCDGASSFGRRRKLGKIPGGALCADPGAINYWSGTFNYVINYHPENTNFAFSECVFAVSGCTDPGASNYLVSASTDDNSCTFPVSGCTDAAATNFDSSATVLEGCVYPRPGCTDSLSTDYVPDANIDDDSCTYDSYGCSDANALNFDSVATVSVGCVARVEEL